MRARRATIAITLHAALVVGGAAVRTARAQARTTPVGAARAAVPAPSAIDVIGARMGVVTMPADTAIRARVPLAAGARPGADGRAPWWAPVASALVPGSGQAALGQDRWIAFVALEASALVRYAADVRDGRRERRAYRRLADQVARALYGTGSRPPGSFEYYETMEKWIESGVYDADPIGATLEPETDPTTFNGAMWLLARQTYWSDPESPPVSGSLAYRNAIAFYERRAIRPEFRWSWRDAQLEQDLYRRAIERSNDAFQRSAQDMAALLANHVLSMVDAYVTVRLRRRPGPMGDETELGASLPWPRRSAGT